MRPSAAFAVLAALLMVACGEQNATPPASSSRAGTSGSPAASALATVVSCSASITPGHQLLLTQLYQEQPALAIYDVADPLHPAPLCKVAPAMGGRFISETRIAFWSGPAVGIADLMSSVVTMTATLPMRAAVGAIGPDATTIVYRVGDDTNGSTTYLHGPGSDRTLFTRPPLGGHGGPPYGPLSQLVFSPDGRYLLAYDFFTTSDDPLDKFQVYAANGSLVFKSPTAEFGAWAPSGDKLYFLQPSQPQSVAGDIHLWDLAGGETTVARGLTSYFWPVVAPGGAIIVFNSYDTSGLPHLWRLELPQGSADELSSAASSKPVFVSSLSIWSDEEQPCQCGPGGNSAPTGRVLNHLIASQDDPVVSYPNPGAGGDPLRLVLDVWLPLQ